MNTHNGWLTIYIREVELEIGYRYFYEAGVHTLSNGDPGYPESSELEIFTIYKDGKDYTPILERYDSMYPKEDIFGEIEESVSENMDDGYLSDYDDFVDRD